MFFWGIFSLLVIAVPLIAVLTWVYSQHRSNRRRKKFLRRYRQRSVGGIRERLERELSTADTQVIPKLRRGRLIPDPLQDGQITGDLLLPKRVRGYTLRPTPYSRRAAPHPDDEIMQRIVDGLKRLD